MSALTTSAILQRMADALPTHTPGDETSDLASSYEAVALLIHAYLSGLQFKLLGFDEEKTLPECQSLAPRLPPSWNDRYGSLSFFYSHKQSSMRFVIRVDRMGGKVEIRGLGVGDDKIYRFERTVKDIVQSSKLPIRMTLDENGQEDRGDLVEKLRTVFVSEEAIAKILHDLKLHIVQKLIPKLQQEGYVEVDDADAQANATSERRAQEARGPNPPFHPPHQPNVPFPQPMNPLPEMARPRPPVGDFAPPDFEDEHQMNRYPGAGGLRMPGRPPLNIGHDDLNPPGLGPHDPLRGSFTGGGLSRPRGSGGMHPTFDDPMFTGEGYGDAQYDPQVPPGARWDPTGPTGPRFGPGRGGSGPFGGVGGGSGPFGGGGGGGGFRGHII